MNMLSPVHSCIFFILFSFIYQVKSQALLDLNEGETCKREENATWTCTKLSDCKDVGDFKQNRPQLCGFEGKEPVVCCPGKRKPSGQALVRCLKYRISACLERFSGQGGQPKVKKHSQMALIGYGRPIAKEWLCSGTLISERYVLSAASCASNTELGVAKWIRLGEETSADHQLREYSINQTILHPEYKPGQPYHNLVIFKLNSEVRFDISVKPACLNVESENRTRKTLMTEWVRPEKGTQVGTYRDSEANMLDGEKCKTIMRNVTSKKLTKGIDPETQICAKEIVTSQSICKSNAGNSLSVSEPEECLKTLIGVSSVGRNCILPGSPEIYTRIIEYIPWIESTVWPSPTA